MRLFLIRHAETEHNVGQVWAGTTDSALTNHGILQIQHLSRYLREQRGLRFDHVFSSDLTRARMTAEGICDNSTKRGIHPEDIVMANPVPGAESSITVLHPEIILTPYLREKDFGSLEGARWSTPVPPVQPSSSSVSTPFVASESEESMNARVQAFLAEFLIPVILDDAAGTNNGTTHRNVAVVSHGMILRALWQGILALFDPRALRVSSEVMTRNGMPGVPLYPPWSNTGFIEMIIEQPQSVSMVAVDTSPPAEMSASTAMLASWSLQLLAVDSKAHLTDLRRTRGGIGSATHDQRQRKIDSFFAKPREP